MKQTASAVEYQRTDFSEGQSKGDIGSWNTRPLRVKLTQE